VQGGPTDDSCCNDCRDDSVHDLPGRRTRGCHDVSLPKRTSRPSRTPACEVDEAAGGLHDQRPPRRPVLEAVRRGQTRAHIHQHLPDLLSIKDPGVGDEWLQRRTRRRPADTVRALQPHGHGSTSPQQRHRLNRPGERADAPAGGPTGEHRPRSCSSDFADQDFATTPAAGSRCGIEREAGSDMVSKGGLVAATVFFALTAILSVVLFRPLGPTGWAVLIASIAFVLFGCLALWKGDALAAAGARRRQAPPVRRTVATDVGAAPSPVVVPESPFIDLDAVVGEPTPDEREALDTTLAALQDLELLRAGEVDVSLMWRAAQASDPGHPVDVYAALASLAVLQELGRLELRRLVFVPVHVEYDADLIAEVAAALLTALGHEIEAGDVVVTLPRGEQEGASTLTVPLEGRSETVPFGFLVKDPPPDLLEALARFVRADDPRELVCTVVDQYLLYAAIPPGGLDALNRHFDGLNRRVPAEYAFSFDPA
jgi:hypothetical protein